MCQLLGLNANTPTDLVFSFTGFATRADEHRDGFGIGFFEGPGARLFVDTVSARVSPVAEMIRRYPLRSQHIISHIRKATQGAVALALWAHCSTRLHALERAHPFATAQLRDDELTVDFAPLTTVQDRVAIVVTEPLTTNEDWVALNSGELAVFVDGRRLPP